jgi:hypothetical protein
MSHIRDYEKRQIYKSGYRSFRTSFKKPEEKQTAPSIYTWVVTLTDTAMYGEGRR